MDKQEMERVVSNLDHRVDRVEQILPTLATKDDLQAAIEPLATKAELQAAIEPLATKAELSADIRKAVEPLATKAELSTAIDRAVEPLATKAALNAAIGKAVEPLATKAELQATKVNLGTAIAEAEQRMRTHFDVVTESLHDDVRLIATGMADLSQRMHQLRGELKTDLAGINRRLMRVEARGAAR